MNFTVNEITNSIAGKPSLSECSVDELQQLTSHYPYFGPGQFLFVKKLKEENSWQLKEQVQKASLYFQNPLWFDHLLNTRTEVSSGIAKTQEEFATAQKTELELPRTQEVPVDNHLQVSTEEAPKDIPTNEEEFAPRLKTEIEIPPTREVAVDNYSKNTTEEVPNDITTYEEEFTPRLETEMEIPVTREEVVDNPLQNTTDEAHIDIAPKEGEFSSNPATETEVPVTHEEVVDQTRLTRQPEFEPAESHGAHQPELLIEMSKFKFEPVDPSRTPLTFEPYHTIDYFASQGIKPATEEKPKDQFSRQLKSFTEWLKVMKKLPVTEIAAAVSVVEEKKVEKMAELSINDREVVTEAMAEVWKKQGNRSKAVDIYEKLSLLNPDKSSYFAAKIDQLKNL